MNQGESLDYAVNRQVRAEVDPAGPAAALGPAAAGQARAFHRTFPEYAVTPLRRLNQLARRLGVSALWVKDEQPRFGLNAFKALGGAFAIGKVLAGRLGEDLASLPLARLRSAEAKARLGEITFVTATDGNHGRGVAWAATQLGQRSVVFMPRGSSPARLENIRRAGAEAAVTALNYDDTVQHARRYAAETGAVLVQDTAWPGYEQIPGWIMQGYTTLVDEALEQLAADGSGDLPTHVLLQAGVGSFPAAVAGHLAARLGAGRPVVIVAEPAAADCLYRSVAAGDGEPRTVTGDLATIMAGLACGVPSATAWPVLRDHADVFVSCCDAVAARGMRMLGNPLPGDPAVVAGESGAGVGLGVLSLMASPGGADLREAARLGPDARVLLINTEGDTDPQGYRDIVWDGKHPSVKA